MKIQTESDKENALEFQGHLYILKEIILRLLL